MSVKFDFGRVGQPFEAEWPVKAPVPQDGGQVEIQEFVAVFRQLDSKTIDEAVKSPDFDAYTLPRMFFVGLGKAEKRELTDELKERMIAMPNIRGALQAAFAEFNLGIAAKN